MKYSLDYYAKNVDKINHYNKISQNEFYEILNNFTISRCPISNEIHLRENNYFIHDIEKIKKDYQNQLPYYIENQKELYKTSSRNNGLKKLGNKTTMYEKDLCKEIWFASYNGVEYPFDVIDIQTPLKKERNDKYGELDLVGVDIDEKTTYLYLIEAKPLSTKETLLRATVESITYKHLITANQEKFINDFQEYMKKYEGKGKKALLIKERLLHHEKLRIVIRSLILVPRKLYEDHPYAKIIYKKYRPGIEYYTVDYDLQELEYQTKDKRVPSLFKKGCYPHIEKYKE